MSRRAAVVVASNRAAAGVYPDRTGPVIIEWLRERGFETGVPAVVPDGSPVRQAIAAAVAAGVDVVLTTGGTGITPTDRTPEATGPLLDRPLPGLADAIRSAGLPQVPTAVLSRGLAGVAGHTLVVNLPGSTGGVRDGLGVLDGVLAHAVDQLHGSDHAPLGGQHAPVAGQHAPANGEHAPANGEHAPANGQHAPVGGQHAPVGGQHAPLGGQHAPLGGEHARGVRLAVVVDEPLDVEEHAALVASDVAGAVVTFAGVVRVHDGGRGVTALHYEGHPNAGDVIARVAEQVAAHDGVHAVAVSHRVGSLAIGDPALVCAVSAAHRGAAFAACADLVDEVKLQLPIWKHQEFTDGTDEWVNCP